MKRLTLGLFLIALGTAAFADGSSSMGTALYDSLIKEVYLKGETVLELNGTQFHYGPYVDEHPLLHAVATDPKALKLFQDSHDSLQTGMVLNLTALGVDLVAISFEVTASGLPKGSNEANTCWGIALGTAVSALVVGIISTNYSSDGMDKFYKGINQYNLDVLTGDS